MPILKIEKLTKKYGKTYALNGLDMEVKKGDIYGFVGPNGAGKTTTLRIISGLLKSDGGDLWLDGVRTTKNILKQKSLIGFVPDFFGVYENLSVIEHLEFFAASYGIYGRAGTVRAREVLEMVELSGKEEQMVDSLSRGIQQRLCLARAMIHKPKLLVLDEPTSFLDIRYKLEILSTLKELVRQRQLAVVLSLHELDLAQRVSDLVVCVHNNAIERCGPPEAVFTSDYITTLYELTQGSYEPGYGSLELPRVQGAVKAFVIGGNGEGIGTYRRLQREGVPFVAGVLHENDVEFPAARALAVEVIAQKAFEPIGAAQYQQAMAWLERCERVFCCCETFGTMNEPNRWLKQAARERGKLVDWTEVPHGL